ncbi:MAG: redoxin family protein [Clostridiales bacterium]|nr:redoxin family protein [Clostridiales bacterium]
MKKISIGIVLVAVLLLGVFLIMGNDNDEIYNNMTKDNMDKDEMTENDMTKDNMDKDEMTENDMTDSDDMVEDNMETAEMMSNDGDMAPMFTLKDLEGNMVSLADLKGEKVYVKFWASWCSICLGGLEELDMLTTEDTEFKVITIVSPDYNGEKNTEKFMSWFDKQGYDNLIVLLDEDGNFTREFGVRGYPTSAFIGSDGVLVHLYPGHLENDMIKAEFMKIN